MFLAAALHLFRPVLLETWKDGLKMRGQAYYYVAGEYLLRHSGWGEGITRKYESSTPEKGG